MKNKNTLKIVIIIFTIGILLTTIGIVQIPSNKNASKENDQSLIDPSNNKDDQDTKDKDNNPPKNDSDVFVNLNGIEIANVEISKEPIYKVTFFVVNHTSEIIKDKKIVLELLNDNTIIKTYEFTIIELEINDKNEFGFTSDNSELMTKDIKMQFSIKE